MGRISRQSGIIFASSVFTAALSYFFKIYLAWRLGAEALGLYALGMTLVGFFDIINGFGLPESAVRFVALYAAAKRFDELRAFLWKGSWILVLSSLASAAVLLAAGPWMVTHLYHSPELIRYLPLFALLMIAGALITFFSKILAGYKEVGRCIVLMRFITNPLMMAGSILLITLGGGLWGYLTAQVVAGIVALVLLISLVWRLTPLAARSINSKKLTIDAEVWTFAAAMFGMGLTEFVIGHADRVALGHFRGAQEVGIYSVAATLVAYETIILQSVNQIFAPVIADLHTRGESALLGRLFQTLTKWMLGLTLPLAIVMVVYSHSIMRIFGHDFERGWPILIAGTCGQLVNCGVGSVGFLLLMSGNQRRLIRVQAIMAGIMALLCIMLVPLWGPLGAAVAAAITNAGVNFWNLIQVKIGLKLSPYNWSYLKLLPSAASVLFITLFLSRTVALRVNWLNPAIAVVLAYLVFCASAWILGLDGDDRLVADAVWARVRGAFGR